MTVESLDQAAATGGQVFAFPSPRRTQGSRVNRFTVESFENLTFEAGDEFLVKGLLPRQGVGVLFGQSQSLKSFVAVDLALHVALGWKWAGRRVAPAPAVYIAAEGSAGIRKRIAGFRALHAPPDRVAFGMVSAAPDLGKADGDLDELCEAISATGVAPGLIVLDTLAQTLAGADENGTGMTAFVRNATALANRFRGFVLVIHHAGLSDDRRMRGHSSLIGACDAQVLAERVGDLATNLTLLKSKDEATGVELVARLERVVLGKDDDGDEISTLAVTSIKQGDGADVPALKRRAAGRLPERLPAAATTALRALRAALADVGATVDDVTEIPSGQQTVTLADWRDRAFKSGVSGSEKANAKSTAFSRAFERLLAEGRIGFWEDRVWLIDSRG